MEILKFTLKGKNAFFKMPEVNTYYYFTYGNIHKVALLGLLGAILGYRGYGQMTKDDEFPEFYEKLRDIQLSVVPKEGSRGHIQKKVQSFNNSVGYASAEQGGNLIVKEQWLENPQWDIYIQIRGGQEEQIKQSILQRRNVYSPYLGSNDHPADIEAPVLMTAFPVEAAELDAIDSLFPARLVQLDYEDDEKVPFKYAEYLPISLKKQTHMYEMEKFVYTNLPVLSHESEVYCVEGKNIIFY